MLLQKVGYAVEESICCKRANPDSFDKSVNGNWHIDSGTRFLAHSDQHRSPFIFEAEAATFAKM
jgi:hypothetical protein